MKKKPVSDTGTKIAQRRKKVERNLIEVGITKKEFHRLLDKASQPIKKAESDSKERKT